MSFRKVSPGTRFKQSPAYTAAWQNAVTDATKYYQEQIQFGKGGDSQPGVSRPPKIRNTTESDLLRGHAVQLGDYILDPVDHRNLWFEGELYEGGTLAVVREATPEGKIGRVQLIGETTVLVDVTDVGHTHATPASGEVVFESATSGPVRLLKTPTETGEQELPAFIGAGDGSVNRKLAIVTSAAPVATQSGTGSGYVLTPHDTLGLAILVDWKWDSGDSKWKLEAQDPDGEEDISVPFLNGYIDVEVEEDRLIWLDSPRPIVPGMTVSDSTPPPVGTYFDDNDYRRALPGYDGEAVQILYHDDSGVQRWGGGTCEPEE